MADREVKARISLEDQLTPALEKIKGSLEDFHGGVVSLSAGLNVLKMAGDVAMKGFEFLGNQMEKAFEEALEGEKAANRLAGALVQSGVYTKELSDALTEHADALELVAGANGETVKEMIATGLQMGLNVEKAKDLEQAARQLAAANNIDVREAFNALNSSLAGNSRALGKLVPQIKDLGAAQLKAGDAIAIVNKATQAQFEIYQTSLPAALSKAEVAFNNVYKAFGQTVTQSPALRAVINQISGLFTELSKFVNDNQKTITSWIDKGIMTAIDVVMGLATAFDAMYRVGTVVFESLKIGAASFAVVIAKVIEGWAGLGSMIPGIGDKFKGAVDTARAAVAGLDSSIQGSMAKIAEATAGPSEAYKLVEDRVLKMRESVELAVASQDSLTESQERGKEEATELAAANNALAGSYGGVALATRKEQEELKRSIEIRDDNLKKFKTYLDARTRLAITAEQEEASEVLKIKAQALGDSEAGRALQLQSAEQNFQLEVQKKYEQAAILGATDEQLNAMAQAANDAHLAAVAAQKEAFIQNDIRQNEQLGNQWGASMAKVRLEQQKHGAVMGTLQGVLASKEVQGTKEMFGNLASLRSSHSKTAFEVGKKAAIAEATINTFKSATSAYAALAGIPIVGPVLGAAAAAAAIAAGFVQIQGINAQQFSPGGQADSGMDSIPQSLSGRSFIVSGGERIVQPEANRELTGFLAEQRGGNGVANRPTTVNITINGKLDQKDADAAVDTMIDALRRASARGVQIISEKGIVKDG
jgi:hypothetical protein